MLITAKVNYGIRAVLELAALGKPANSDALASAQGLPPGFLSAILGDLRRAGILVSQRGAEGGFSLARLPSDITVGEVARALDFTMTDVGGRLHLKEAAPQGASRYLDDVWVAMQWSLREVLDGVTLEHVVSGQFPAWMNRILVAQEPVLPSAGA